MTHARIRNPSTALPSYKTAGLAISMSGHRYHETPYLEACVELINRRFESCFIDLTDRLYEHNFMAQGMAVDDAREQAIRLGDEWLSRNAEALKRFSIPVRVTRWAEWDGAAGEIGAECQRLYESDANFRNSVDQDAVAFVGRRERSPEERRHSVNFILEECAVLTAQCRATPHAAIYPGREMSTLSRMRNLEFPDAPRGLERSVYCRVTFD
jgi:tRNA-dependent cyclodipeptide synthase